MSIQFLVSGFINRYSLPEWLVMAIIQVESGGDTNANRFERGFYQRYVLPIKDLKVIPPCSLETERINRATSWGLMQVMGQVARERGFADPFLTALCKPAVGIEYGCKQLAYLADRYGNSGGTWEGVIRAYNGGSPHADNINYLKKVMAARG